LKVSFRVLLRAIVKRQIRVGVFDIPVALITTSRARDEFFVVIDAEPIRISFEREGGAPAWGLTGLFSSSAP
jgi:hypothetical protein